MTGNRMDAGPRATGRPRAARVRRRGDRRGWRRAARRDRRPRRGGPGGHRLQVAAGQGAHRDGRGRHRRGDGQRLPEDDNWQVHFRDTMRGGKMLNNWRMAQLHAQEAPERVLELEEWGALFDRTADGLISQRDFGGHRYARLAHVGDRTGLEMIRTLQQRAVALGIDVFMECTVTEIFKEGDRVSGAFAYWRETGRFVVFEAPTVVLATGGIGKSYQVTSNSWEYTGDGHALAMRTGASLINMEFVQFHPTGMVWPPSVKGILVTESVRGDGGVLKNSEGERFMFDYIPEFFKAETADTVEEAEGWYTDKKNHRRPPELLPARRGGPRDQLRDQGRPGVTARRRLPRHRLAPRRRVHPAPAAVDVPPVQGARRRRHHRRADGGRADLPLRDGRRRGRRRHRAEHRRGAVRRRRGGRRHARLQPARRQLAVGPAGVRPPRRPQRGVPLLPRARAPAEGHRRAGEGGGRRGAARRSRWRAARTPTRSRRTCRTSCSAWSGSSASEDELRESLEEIEKLKARAKKLSVEGHRQYNPGWHLALDLANMLVVSECIAKAALERRSRAAATPATTSPRPTRTWGALNLVLTLPPGGGGRWTSAPAAAGHARRPASRCSRRAEPMGYDLKMRVWRGDASGGDLGDYTVRGRGGRGRARRDPPAPGHPGRRPRGPLELQGRQVRLVQRGDQRPAAADVHDPALGLRRDRDDHGHPDAGLPGDPRPGHRRLVQLREGQAGPGGASSPRATPTASAG